MEGKVPPTPAAWAKSPAGSGLHGDEAMSPKAAFRDTSREVPDPYRRSPASEWGVVDKYTLAVTAKYHETHGQDPGARSKQNIANEAMMPHQVP